MIEFVKDAKLLYGKSFISYNVHNMIHLHEDYSLYGNLESVSCFPFESYLGSEIKGSIRGGYKPLQQISAYISKKNSDLKKKCTAQRNIELSSIITCTHNEAGICYKNLHVLGKTVLKNDKQSMCDSVVQLKSCEIAVVNGIHLCQNKITLLVSCFKKRDNFFSNPIPSNTVGVYLVSDVQAPKWISVDELFAKMFLSPYKSEYVAQLMPHTLFENTY